METWQTQTSQTPTSVTRAHVSGSAVLPGPVSGAGPDLGGGSGGRFAGDLTSVRFAQIARQLNQVAKEHNLRAPAFRSPPRVAGARRTIKRRKDGSATVSVSLRGRPAAAVVADMIDGVMAANEPGSTRSAGFADRLWSAATPFLSEDEDRQATTAVRNAA